MQYNITETRKMILDLLSYESIKYEISDFPSGCCMIDLWVKDQFYVIQIEPGSIGISLVDGPDLSTIPDENFFDFTEFSKKLNKILKD